MLVNSCFRELARHLPRQIQYIEVAHETVFVNAFAGFILNMPIGSAMIGMYSRRVGRRG